MSILELIIFLVIAGVCGATARAIAGGTAGGFTVSVLLGFLGAFVGNWLAHVLRLPEVLEVDIGGHAFPIVWSIIGGIALVALAHFLMRPSYRWHARH